MQPANPRILTAKPEKFSFWADLIRDLFVVGIIAAILILNRFSPFQTIIVSGSSFILFSLRAIDRKIIIYNETNKSLTIAYSLYRFLPAAEFKLDQLDAIRLFDNRWPVIKVEQNIDGTIKVKRFQIYLDEKFSPQLMALLHNMDKDGYKIYFHSDWYLG